MAHVDPAPSAPPATPSAPDKVTVALATAAGGLRAHHRCPGRPGGLGHPAAPTGTAKPGTRPRPADPPDRASPKARVDAHDRPAGADQCVHPLDHYLSDRAAGRQRADHHGWTGQRPSTDHGGHDDEHRGVLDPWRHQHPPPGDRPDDHGRATHDRADDHGRPHHDHPGHHDQHRAPHHRADHDRCRADQHNRVGDPVTVGSRQPSRRRWSVRSCRMWACGRCWGRLCPNPGGMHPRRPAKDLGCRTEPLPRWTTARLQHRRATPKPGTHRHGPRLVRCLGLVG
jgi:hypothetical protein